MSKIEVIRTWSEVGKNKPLLASELSEMIGEKVYYGVRNNRHGVCGNYVEVVSVEGDLIKARGSLSIHEFKPGTLFKDEISFLNWALSGNVNTEYRYS